MYGIERYDLDTNKMQQVWSSAEAGWSSYIFSAKRLNNTYYAAVQRGYSQKYGVLKSRDGFEWSKFLEFSDQEGVGKLRLATGRNELYIIKNGKLYRLKTLN